MKEQSSAQASTRSVNDSDREDALFAGLCDPREAHRTPYETPRVSKGRAITRTTLFSGGGVSAGGLTASG